MQNVCVDYGPVDVNMFERVVGPSFWILFILGRILTKDTKFKKWLFEYCNCNNRLNYLLYFYKVILVQIIFLKLFQFADKMHTYFKIMPLVLLEQETHKPKKVFLFDKNDSPNRC